MLEIAEVRKYLLSLQNKICSDLESIDGEKKFDSDVWFKEGIQGDGDTRTLSGGRVFEKAGVAFSHVFGSSLPPAATAKRPDLNGRSFEALGVSLVIHPQNPFVPTAHMNVRLFVASKQDAAPVWWFGGGFDLTPYYPFEEDCRHWHRQAKDACDLFGPDVYPKLKKWCDEYFFLKHRNEARGIGGLFFDDWNHWDFDTCFAFQRSVGDAFTKAYLPIVERRMNTKFGENERFFQQYRRGRYVEFNLVWDRGTLFGLQAGGRTESILMSMPPISRWEYSWKPKPGSPEAALTDHFLKARDWID